MPDYSTPLYWRGHRFLIESGNLARAVKRANRGATASEFLSTALLDREAAVLFGNRPSMDELAELAAVLYDDARDALPQDAADPFELTRRERATRAPAALLASGHRLDDGRANDGPRRAPRRCPPGTRHGMHSTPRAEARAGR